MATIDEEKKRRTAFTTDLPESGHLKNMPAPASPSIPAGFMPGTRAVFNESGKTIKDLASQGRYGAAAGETARGMLAYVPAVADDVIGQPLRTIGPGILDAGRQFFGMNKDATRDVKAGSPQAQDPNRGQPAPTAPTALEKAIPITSPNMNGKPPGENPAGEVASSAQEIAPGVFKQGRGQYSDSAQGMGFVPGFTGRPNAQNMAAAEALAQRSAARGFQPQAEAQGPVVSIMRDTSGGAGMSREEANMLRTLTMNAQQLKPGARAALKAFHDGLSQRKADDLARERMGMESENASADRGFRQQELTARMVDAEATRALRAQEVGDNMATNAMRREAAGFEVQAAREIQGLRQQFMAAKTDKERSEIAAKIQALQGKAQEQTNRFTVVPGGQEIQMVGGFPTPVTRPSMVLNNQTGQFVNQGGMEMQQALPPITQNPKAMEIKNDPSMTLEQKRAALIALGYQ